MEKSFGKGEQVEKRMVRAAPVVFLLVITIAALLVRLSFFSFHSADYNVFLQKWFARLKANGGPAAIGMEIGDYTPPYIYLMALLTCFPAADLVLIKTLSFLGDVVMACYAMRIVRRKGRRLQGEIAYAVTLFLPSVVLNSSAWGQCDSLYTAALLACVCYLMEGRQYASMAAFSVAFIFKLQSVFLAPFLFLMLLMQRIRWRTVWVVPAVYAVSILPAALMGRSIRNLLGIYFRQTKEYVTLCLNFPNLSAWFPERLPKPWGTVFALCGILLAFAALLVVWKWNLHLTDGTIVVLALFSLLFVPYFLPYMHERYFYPANVLAVLFAFYFPKKFYVAVLAEFSSLIVVGNYLFENMRFISLKFLSVLMLLCIVCVGVQLASLARKSKREEAKVRPAV